MPPAEGPRYSDKELALILHRAAELQHPLARARAEGYSLAELQEIAADAGISPESVEEAARRVRMERSGLSAVPGGWVFSDDRVTAGTLTAADRADLLDVVRRWTGARGTVSLAGDDTTWTSRGETGFLRVTLRQRGGEFRVALDDVRKEVGLFLWVGSGVGGFFAGTISAIVLRGAGMPRGWALLAGLGVAVAVTAGAAKAIGRSLARRYATRLATLGEQVADAARRMAGRAPGGALPAPSAPGEERFPG